MPVNSVSYSFFFFLFLSSFTSLLYLGLDQLARKSHSVIRKPKSMFRFTAQCIVANLGFLREKMEIIKELSSFVETWAISFWNVTEPL